MASEPLVEWETGLFGCSEEIGTCCYGFWCCPCLACTVSEKFGENPCLPLYDFCISSTLAALGLPLFAPPAGLSLRAAMRNRYGIKGSLCEDIAIACCCSWCSWCQMDRMLKHRKKKPTVVNVQNITFYGTQPMMMPQGFVDGYVNQRGALRSPQ